MTALITLSGVGYDYLYMGTAADAANNKAQWIKYNGTAAYILDGVTKQEELMRFRYPHWINQLP